MTKSPRSTTLILACLTATGAAAAGAHLPALPETREPTQLLAPESGPERFIEASQLAPLPCVDDPVSSAGSLPTDHLSERVSAALLGKSKHDTTRKPKAKTTTSAAVIPRRWTCSDWQELWQGSGKARNCDWR